MIACAPHQKSKTIVMSFTFFSLFSLRDSKEKCKYLRMHSASSYARVVYNTFSETPMIWYRTKREKLRFFCASIRYISFALSISFPLFNSVLPTTIICNCIYTHKLVLRTTAITAITITTTTIKTNYACSRCMELKWLSGKAATAVYWAVQNITQNTRHRSNIWNVHRVRVLSLLCMWL